VFTGLVEEVGHIREIKPSRGARLFRIRAQTVLQDLQVDDSISVSGVCLTVIHRDEQSFAVEAVEETLKKTTLAYAQSGTPVNLERALTLNRRLGGHLVQGHVDGIGCVKGLSPQAGGKLLTVELPPALFPYVVPKGSIAVDGVSLTVAELDPPHIRIALIPHTLEVTTLGRLQPGDKVNIEVDMIGKYVVQLVQPYLQNRSDWLKSFDVKLED